MKRISLLVAFAVLFCCHINAQVTTFSGYDTLTLQDLMKIKITVASIRELTPQESPGVVTTISGEQIKLYGARDLMDILELVPGFQFASDVEGVVGLGVRGNWAHEGKVVLFIDGQEMNEGLYNSLQFGNHYPLDNIDRIEIIRGPGSALYGGNAAYAVINMISKNPDAGFHAEVKTVYSATSEATSRKSTNINIGTKHDKISASLQGYFSEGQRSTDQYTDVYGNSYLLNGQSALDNTYINGRLNAGNFGIKALVDLYHTQTRDEYQHINSEPKQRDFDSYFLEANYKFNIGEHFKIQPKFNYKYQLPWVYNPAHTDSNDMAVPFKVSNQRTSAGFLFFYDPDKAVNISSGIQYFYDRSVDLIGPGFKTNGTNDFTYANLSAFAQILYKKNLYNYIAGIRLNANSRYEKTIVPRLGITRETEKYHFKALYSRSFRAPGTMNIDLSPSIKPEVTNVFEMEGGISLSHCSYLQANAYLIFTNNPIVYYYDSLNNDDAYMNSAVSGTKGFELTYKFKKSKFALESGLSYYHSENSKGYNLSDVPGYNGQHLGFSPFKFNSVFSWFISSCWSASVTTSYYSDVFGIKRVTEVSREPIYHSFAPSTFININTGYSFGRKKQYSIGASVFNLLNNEKLYIQPYSSLHAPLKGTRREFILKTSLKF